MKLLVINGPQYYIELIIYYNPLAVNMLVVYLLTARFFQHRNSAHLYLFIRFVFSCHFLLQKSYDLFSFPTVSIILFCNSSKKYFCVWRQPTELAGNHGNKECVSIAADGEGKNLWQQSLGSKESNLSLFYTLSRVYSSSFYYYFLPFLLQTPYSLLC